MTYYLPAYRSSGLQIYTVPVNVNNRVYIYESGGGTQEIVNSPDAAPGSGGKFPVFEFGGVDPDDLNLISFRDGALGETVLEGFLDGATPGDANTNERLVVRDGESWFIRARLTNSEGMAYSSDGFSAVTVKVFDLSTGSTNLYPTTALDVANLVSTELTDWEIDQYGYNVFVTITPASLSSGMEGGHVYKAELAFTLSVGGARIVESWAVCRSEGSG